MSPRSRPIPVPNTPRSTAGPVRLSFFLDALAAPVPDSPVQPYPVATPAPVPRRRRKRLP